MIYIIFLYSARRHISLTATVYSTLKSLIMNSNNLNTPLSQSIMAGLFMGIVATIVSLVYNIIFREKSGFQLCSIINVSTIIFSVPFVLLLAGFLYSWMRTYKMKDVFFIVLFILFTIGCIYLDFHIQRSDDPAVNLQFRILLMGIIVITGISSFFIPYLSTHETDII